MVSRSSPGPNRLAATLPAASTARIGTLSEIAGRTSPGAAGSRPRRRARRRRWRPASRGPGCERARRAGCWSPTAWAALKRWAVAATAGEMHEHDELLDARRGEIQPDRRRRHQEAEHHHVDEGESGIGQVDERDRQARAQPVPPPVAARSLGKRAGHPREQAGLQRSPRGSRRRACRPSRPRPPPARRAGSPPTMAAIITVWRSR